MRKTFIGIEEIQAALGGVQAALVLRCYREYALPIFKRNGIWIGFEGEIRRWQEWYRTTVQAGQTFERPIPPLMQRTPIW